MPRSVFNPLVAVLLASSLSLASAGTLVAIGGALEPDNAPIYEAIGNAALPGPICLLGTASSDPAESAESYRSDFGAVDADTVVVDITEENAAESAFDATVAAQLEACGGFFFVGGDQRRITAALLPGGEPTPALEAIRGRFEAGAVVAGTSAGAAMMGEVMISGGGSVETLLGADGSDGGVETEAGLGFVDDAILDQHFVARGRYGRLLGAMREHSVPLGAGIDEDTALVIGEDGAWEVVGTNTVALLERRAEGDGESVLVSLLSHGDRFDPASGEIAIAEGRDSIAELGPYYEAGDIFAVDAFGPNVLRDLLTVLVDSPETRASGLGFAGGSNSVLVEDGVRVIFERTDATAGYWGRVDGEDYSVVRVGMRTEPVVVYVVPKD